MWLAVTHFAHLPVPWKSRMKPNTTCSHFHVSCESNCRYFLTVYWEHRSNNKSINSEWNNDQSSHIFVFCRKTSVQGTQACFSGLMIFFFFPERNYNLCFEKKMSVAWRDFTFLGLSYAAWRKIEFRLQVKLDLNCLAGQMGFLLFILHFILKTAYI